VSYLIYAVATTSIEFGAELDPKGMSPRRRIYAVSKNGEVWGPPPRLTFG